MGVRMCRLFAMQVAGHCRACGCQAGAGRSCGVATVVTRDVCGHPPPAKGLVPCSICTAVAHPPRAFKLSGCCNALRIPQPGTDSVLQLRICRACCCLGLRALARHSWPRRLPRSARPLSSMFPLLLWRPSIEARVSAWYACMTAQGWFPCQTTLTAVPLPVYAVVHRCMPTDVICIQA